MRAWLFSAAALAALIALALALRLGGGAREAAVPERGAEPAGADVRPAAELADVPDLDQGERVAAPVPTAPEKAPAGAVAPQQRELAAQDGATAELIVTVVAEENERPLPGVPLIYLPRPPQRMPEDFSQEAPVTDEHGRATLRLPAGGTQVYNLQQEDRKLIVELAPGEKREEILRLRSHADLDFHLVIVDAQDGAPLAGAEVELDCYPKDPIVGLWTATADADGAVAPRVASWITYHAQVSAAGYTSRSVGLGGAHASREHARRIALERVAQLRGSVTDSAGAAQAGVTVSAHAQEEGIGFASGGHDGLAELYWASKTDLEGRYVLGSLPANVGLSFKVRAGERLLLDQRTTLRLAPGESRAHDLLVDVAGGIRGVVLDATGAPIGHQALWLGTGSEAREFNWFEDPVRETTTDGEGRFAFEGVPRGTWLIGPKALEERPPDDPMSIGQVVELPEGVPWVEVELRPPAGLFVAGSCVDRKGKPVAGAGVSAVAVGAWATASAQSAADGTFTLGPLPAGELALFTTHETLVLDSREIPRVQSGDTGIVLRFAVGARVRGTVIDAASGAPLSAEVAAFAGQVFSLRGTAASGAFEFQRLTPGRCVFLARTSPGLVSAPYAVDVGEGEEASIELQVAPGGTVQVLMPEGGEPTWACLLVDGDMIAVLNIGDGTTSLVPPGPFAVELRNLGGVLETREGTAVAGKTVEIDLR